MGRKEQIDKKQAAYRLYMNGESRNSIAEQVNVSPATITKWSKVGGWAERLQDERTSSVELANSLMLAAKKLTEIIIEQINSDKYDISTITKCSDNIVKIMASAERIANTVNKATVIDVLTALDTYLLTRSATDPKLTPELISTINYYHQEYINYIKGRES